MSTRRIFSVFLLCFFFSSASFVDVFSVEEVIIFKDVPEVKPSRFWEALRYIAVKTKLRELFYPTGVVGPDEEGKTFSSRVWKLTIKDFNGVDVEIDKAFSRGNNVTHLTIENCEGEWAHVVEKFPKLKTLLVRNSLVDRRNIFSLLYPLIEPQMAKDVQSIKFINTKTNWNEKQNKLFDYIRNASDEKEVEFPTISSFANEFFSHGRKYSENLLTIKYETLKAELVEFIVRERRYLRSLGVIGIGYAEKVILAEGDRLVATGDIRGSANALCKNFGNQRDASLISDDFIIQDGFKFIFTGNIAGRGKHGVEAWTMLLRLKNNNSVGGERKVLIARGNHETREMAPVCGFTEEIDSKYPDNAEELKVLFSEVFKLLSCAYFLKCPDDNFIQVNHGGPVLIPKTKPKEPGALVTSVVESGGLKKEFNVPDWFKNLEDQPNIWKLKSEIVLRALLWNNYKGAWGGDLVPGDFSFYTVGTETVKENYEKFRVKAILRGHKPIDYPVSYEPRGRKVPTDVDHLMSEQFNVFTFMSMPEARADFENCGYGVVTVGSTYEKSTIRAYKYVVE